jgi:photosystem II stability/assembly factor-like uncharacterized protein
MKKALLQIGVLVAAICIAGAFSGCNKPRQPMKVPKINMITSESLHSVITPDDKNIWVIGAYGAIFHSVDGGVTWKAQTSGVNWLLADGVFLNTKEGWVAGLNGTILHTADSGETWQKQNTGTDKHLFAVSFVDPQNGWAIGEWNTIIHTADGGKTWAPQSQEGDKILNNVLFTDAQNGWVVGEQGTIMKTTDGGQTWETLMPEFFKRATAEEEFENPRPAIFGIFAVDKNNIILCGIEGTILRTADAGATWEKCLTDVNLGIYNIALQGAMGWGVGDKGTYIVTTDGGKTWKQKDDVIKTKLWLHDIAFTSPEKGWAVGANGTAVKTKDGGKTWEFYSGLSYAMEFFTMPKALEFKGMVFE